MPQNKLTDLNNHLFEEMERLMDDDLSGEDMKKEIKRANAITSVSNQIISNMRLQTEIVQMAYDMGDVNTAEGAIKLIENEKH